MATSAFAPAKVNFYLELIAKRNDGYHELETVMAPVDLCDHITIKKNDSGCVSIRLIHRLPRLRSASEIDLIPVDHTNLACVALERMFAKAGLDPTKGGGAEITIIKRIPSAAGLGGASSDAATVLRLANQLWDINFSKDILSEIAAEIGSDVPFFLHTRAAICTGRGEIVRPLKCRLKPGIVIIKPPVGFSTAAIYSRAEVPGQANRMAKSISSLAGSSLSQMGKSLFNRLEQAAGEVSDWVARLKEEFAKTDCLGHQLSGSGSSYFGIFGNRSMAQRAANVLRARIPQVAVFCCGLHHNVENHDWHSEF